MKIKEIRNKLGLTQAELANILGLSSQNYISKYESGERVPSLQIKMILYLLDKKIINIKTLKRIQNEIHSLL